MLAQVQLDVALQGRQDEAASPPFPLSVRNRATDGTARCKEEQVDMRIGLGNDGKVAVELGVEGPEGYVFSEWSAQCVKPLPISQR